VLYRVCEIEGLQNYYLIILDGKSGKLKKLICAPYFDISPKLAVSSNNILYTRGDRDRGHDAYIENILMDLSKSNPKLTVFGLGDPYDSGLAFWDYVTVEYDCVTGGFNENRDDWSWTPLDLNSSYLYDYNIHTLFSQNKNTGKVIWRSRIDDDFGLDWLTSHYFADLVVDSNDNLFVVATDENWGFTRSYLFCVDGKTGKLKWKLYNNKEVYTSPTIGSNNLVYIGTSSGFVYALSKENGSKKWEFETGFGNLTKTGSVKGKSVYHPPVIGEDMIFFGALDGKLYALDRNTGIKRWEYATEHYGCLSPAIGDDGILYFTSHGEIQNGDRNWGYVYAVKSSNGELIWKHGLDGGYQSEYPYPLIGKGILYVQDSGGLYAIKISSQGTAHTDWPVVHHDNQGTGISAPRNPIIITELQNLTVHYNQSININVVAKGFDQLKYQWFKDGEVIANESKSDLYLSNIKKNDEGEYYVIVKCEYGETKSNTFRLTITTPKTPTIQIVQKQSNDITLLFNDLSSVTYRLQFSNDLINWQSTADSISQTEKVDITVRPSQDKRFYRLKLAD